METNCENREVHAENTSWWEQLNFEELITTPCEVEAVCYGRPLSYLSSDNTELEPLSPSHLSIGKRLVSLPTTLESLHIGSSSPASRRRLIARRKLMESICKRRKKEYLLLLRSCHENRRAAEPQIHIGDVVILEDDFTFKLFFKLGRADVLHPGKDGISRAGTVRLSDRSYVRRLVKKLYLLETAESLLLQPPAEVVAELDDDEENVG